MPLFAPPAFAGLAVTLLDHREIQRVTEALIHARPSSDSADGQRPPMRLPERVFVLDESFHKVVGRLASAAARRFSEGPGSK
jgi:hypothetical protein